MSRPQVSEASVGPVLADARQPETLTTVASLPRVSVPGPHVEDLSWLGCACQTCSGLEVVPRLPEPWVSCLPCATCGSRRYLDSRCALCGVEL